MPAERASSSSRTEKSMSPGWLLASAWMLSRVADAVGMAMPWALAAPMPRSMSLSSSLGVNVVVKSRFTSAGVLYLVYIEPRTLLLIDSRNTWRGMPAFSASSVISHREWMITPNMVLWAIFHTRDSSPSPTYIAARPSAASNGCTASYSAFGPEATTSSLPALATLALPETGALR